MLDLGHIPLGRNCDVQIFRSAGQFQWVKPRGRTMCTMFLGAAGGGGGGGHTAAAGNQRGGGGGGSSSGQWRLEIPTILFPDYLIVEIGAGGLGGAATFDGSDGTATKLYWPSQATTLISVPPGLKGLKGDGTVGGTGGTAGTAAAVTAALSQLGVVISIGGVAGAVGHASAGGNSVIAFVFSGGASGAGATSADATAAGGTNAIPSGYAYMPNIGGGTGGAAGGNPGGHGYQVMPADIYGGLSSATPMWFMGGAGGGSSGTSGVGGRGGDGNNGSGGGGGGGGVTGGAGGNGGDGIAIFVSW